MSSPIIDAMNRNGWALAACEVCGRDLDEKDAAARLVYRVPVRFLGREVLACRDCLVTMGASSLARRLLRTESPPDVEVPEEDALLSLEEQTRLKKQLKEARRGRAIAEEALDGIQNFLRMRWDNPTQFFFRLKGVLRSAEEGRYYAYDDERSDG